MHHSPRGAHLGGDSLSRACTFGSGEEEATLCVCWGEACALAGGGWKGEVALNCFCIVWLVGSETALCVMERSLRILCVCTFVHACSLVLLPAWQRMAVGAGMALPACLER